MAPKTTACLLLALALAACGGAGEEGSDQAADMAAIRARRAQKTAAVPAAKPADSTRHDSAGANPPVAPAAGADSAAAAAAAAAADSANTAARDQAGVLRETFAYSGGNRDPFASLMDLQTVGPEIGDLTLVGIYQDLRGGDNSIAVVREKTQDGRRFKLRVGDQIGRMRVASIRPRDVVFTIEDFGYARQETLSLRKQEDVIP